MYCHIQILAVPPSRCRQGGVPAPPPHGAAGSGIAHPSSTLHGTQQYKHTISLLRAYLHIQPAPVQLVTPAPNTNELAPQMLLTRSSGESCMGGFGEMGLFGSGCATRLAVSRQSVPCTAV